MSRHGSGSMGRGIRPELYGVCLTCGAAPRRPCISVKGSRPLKYLHPDRMRIKETWRTGPSTYAQLVTRVLLLEDKNPADLVKVTGMAHNSVYRHIAEVVRPMSHRTAIMLMAAMGYRVEHVVSISITKASDEPINPTEALARVDVKLGNAVFTASSSVDMIRRQKR